MEHLNMGNVQKVAQPLIVQEDRVLTLAEFASIAGISLVTFRRLIARGDGPAVTKLSIRRLGVRISHAMAWLDSRTSSGSKAPPDPADLTLRSVGG
jgi:predicted DNA-binding transcriptional regulator AlpA